MEGQKLASPVLACSRMSCSTPCSEGCIRRFALNIWRSAGQSNLAKDLVFVSARVKS